MACIGGTGEIVEQTLSVAPGAQVRIRDEQWLVRAVTATEHDGWMLEVTGVSAFVRETEAIFYTGSTTSGARPGTHTRLVGDDSPHHRRARLYLEASIRKTALPQTEHGLAFADGFLMDRRPTSSARPSWPCRCATRSRAS